MSARTLVPGWPHADSPFHAGEQAVQARTGMRERMDGVGRRLVRDFMPDEHRELFERLPYLFVGSEDGEGLVWASMLTGAPGFVHTPDALTLRIDAGRTLAPPLDTLHAGAKVGLLGIELSTRRRNRANGVVLEKHDKGFSMHVEQCFGNCPQYIHARDVDSDVFVPAELAREGTYLSAASLALVERSDTFFIATTSGSGDGPSHGLDVSHRGGPAGFVGVASSGGGTVLYWPDYRGNSMFCTLGNLELDPRAGLLFVDFASHATLALTGRATIHESAEGRYLRFEVSRGFLARVRGGVSGPM